MDERRQAFRRAGVTIDLSETDHIVVLPIPWEQRTDFGNEVIRQHVEVINDAVKLYADPETGIPQLQAKLAEKFNDPQALMKLGLLPELYESLHDRVLYFNQIVAILVAAAEVNDLPQLIPLLDPNSTTPTMLGGLLSELTSGFDSTLKTESGPDSFSPDSVETPSENLPSPSLVSSSTNSPEAPGTIETGP